MKFIARHIVSILRQGLVLLVLIGIFSQPVSNAMAMINDVTIEQSDQDWDENEEEETEEEQEKENEDEKTEHKILAQSVIYIFPEHDTELSIHSTNSWEYDIEIPIPPPDKK